MKTTRYRLNYGPNFYATGVPTINPSVITPPYEDNPANGPIYPTFVPKNDVDGNEIAGIRLPELTAPLATCTGWALRAGPQANDGCEGSGQYIPFPKTKAERQASGDPRKSAEERYKSMDKYGKEVARAIDKATSGSQALTQTVTIPAQGLRQVNFRWDTQVRFYGCAASGSLRRLCVA